MKSLRFYALDRYALLTVRSLVLFPATNFLWRLCLTSPPLLSARARSASACLCSLTLVRPPRALLFFPLSPFAAPYFYFADFVGSFLLLIYREAGILSGPA